MLAQMARLSNNARFPSKSKLSSSAGSAASPKQASFRRRAFSCPPPNAGPLPSPGALGMPVDSPRALNTLPRLLGVEPEP